jgi:DNA-binding MarR family transcriptional regulator
MEPSNHFAAALYEWIEVFMRRSFRNFLLYSKESGLSMSQIGALIQIHRRGVSGVSDVGDDLGITSAGASQMLERLVQQGLIVRSEDPNDRRVKQIALTDKGYQVLRDSMHARQGWLVDLGKSLTALEHEQVVAALNLLIKKANQLEKELNKDPIFR